MIPPLDPARDAWPHGPSHVVLIGPPGTGKTRSLLHTWLLPALRRGVRPSNILACSFTKAAAGEVSARLARELDADPKEFRYCCSTIHSEAFRLLRHAHPGTTVHDTDERLAPDAQPNEEASAEPEKRLRESPLRAAMRTVWDFARNTLAEGDTVEERLEATLPRFADDRRISQYTIEQLAADALEYERGKRERGAIDFTDMLELALDLGAPARELLVVDEAQDLSPLQWQLVAAWGRAARRVVLIGDPDQAIYGWNGGDAMPLGHYARSSGWTVRRLAKSHRVPRAAHRLARDLILQDPERMDAPYDPADHAGAAEDVSRAEVRAALDAFVDVTTFAAPRRPEALVLARSRATLSGGIARELAVTGVPFLSEKGYSPLGAPSALAVARAIVGLRAGGAYVRDVRQLLHELPARGHFPPRRKQQLMVEVNEWPEDAKVSVETLEAMGIGVRSLLAGTLVDGLRAAKIGQDKRSVSLGRDRAAELDLLVDRWGPQVLEGRPTIVLTTLHASKGREAELVVIDMDMPWPSAKAIEQGEDGEERRLLYVGLTRTKDRLLLLRSSREKDLGHALGLAGVATADVSTPAAHLSMASA